MNHRNNVVVVLLLLLFQLLVGSSFANNAAVTYASPKDCEHVCDGVFAFRTKQLAQECCQQTRNYASNAMTLDAKDVSTQSGSVTLNCRELGGPSRTFVQVRFPTENNSNSATSFYCPVCVGATAKGSQCTGGRPVPGDNDEENDNGEGKKDEEGDFSNDRPILVGVQEDDTSRAESCEIVISLLATIMSTVLGIVGF